MYQDVSRITLVIDEAPVGICKCGEYTRYNKENNTNIGEVGILGVIKSHRKKGIGKALLSDTMKWLHDRGIDTINISMDAENRNALGLYTSLGFKIEREDTVYHLKLK